MLLAPYPCRCYSLELNFQGCWRRCRRGSSTSRHNTVKQFPAAFAVGRVPRQINHVHKDKPRSCQGESRPGITSKNHVQTTAKVKHIHGEAPIVTLHQVTSMVYKYAAQCCPPPWQSRPFNVNGSLAVALLMAPGTRLFPRKPRVRTLFVPSLMPWGLHWLVGALACWLAGMLARWLAAMSASVAVPRCCR